MNPAPAEVVFTPRVVLPNAKFATNANAQFIFAEKLTPGCNVRGNPKIPDPKNYREVYHIVRDHWDEWKDGEKTGRKIKGYSFIEVNHGMGGWGGVQPSVRKLVIAAITQGVFGWNDVRIVYRPGGAK